MTFIQHNLNRTAFPYTQDGQVFSNAKEGADQINNLLWSDPSPIDGARFNEKRGIATSFGKDVTENFLSFNKFNFLIRSHQLRSSGFQKEHEKCFTVFSASFYCGQNNNGSIIEFMHDSTSITNFEYRTQEFDEIIKTRKQSSISKKASTKPQSVEK